MLDLTGHHSVATHTATPPSRFVLTASARTVAQQLQPKCEPLELARVACISLGVEPPLDQISAALGEQLYGNVLLLDSTRRQRLMSASEAKIRPSSHPQLWYLSGANAWDLPSHQDGEWSIVGRQFRVLLMHLDEHEFTARGAPPSVDGMVLFVHAAQVDSPRTAQSLRQLNATGASIWGAVLVD